MKMRRLLSYLLLAVPAEFCSGMKQPPAPPAPAHAEIVVGAAANLQTVLPPIAEAYQRATGQKVNLMFAATGILAQQIKAGAPIDLFLAADTASVQKLVSGGHAHPSPAGAYAIGRLVLAISPRAEFSPPSLEQIVDPRIHRIGIANPDLAPYGAAARRACARLNMWEKIQAHLIIGENAGQVMTYAVRNEVDVAFVPLSLAMEKKIRFIDVSTSLYEPLEQSLAVPVSAKNPEGAKSFANYILKNTSALEILGNNGYTIPVMGQFR